MTIEQLRATLRRKCEKAGSVKAWSDAHAISAVYVSDVIGGRREPGRKVLVALGLEKVVSFEPVGAGGRVISTASVMRRRITSVSASLEAGRARKKGKADGAE